MPRSMHTVQVKVAAVTLANTRRLRLRGAELPDDEAYIRLLMSRWHPGRTCSAASPPPSHRSRPGFIEERQEP